MRTVVALISILGIILSASSCAANQFAPAKMLSAELSVDLSHGGTKETWRVFAKLSEDRRTLGSLVVQSPRTQIEVPKELIGDLDRPDLSSIQVMTMDPSVGIVIAYGSVGPKYLEPPCPYEETRFQVLYSIEEGKPVERYFLDPEQGFLDQDQPGVVPKHPKSSYDEDAAGLPPNKRLQLTAAHFGCRAVSRGRRPPAGD